MFWEKVVKPTSRKRLVGYLQDSYGISQRRACRVVPISRKSMWYQPQRPSRDADLAKRMKELGEQYPRYGYLMLHELLRREGLVVNRKRTYRLYSELGMQVRTKRRKKLVRPHIPLEVPNGPNQRWSTDFVHHQLTDSWRIRILNVVDDYSRVCVGQLVDLSIAGERTARFLSPMGEARGLPNRIVMDNGPELTSKVMFIWSQQAGAKLHFIQPDKPTQNAFVESFNGRFRDGCLNQYWFHNLDDARRIVDAWREHYNQIRPHSALSYRSPAEFERAA